MSEDFRMPVCPCHQNSTKSRKMLEVIGEKAPLPFAQKWANACLYPCPKILKKGMPKMSVPITKCSAHSYT